MRRTRQLALGCLALLALSLSAPATRAQDAELETAKKVPPGIHHVTAGGYWTRANAEGFFRVVVIAGGFEHVNHWLFIQWLRSDPNTQDYELIRTVNVQEVNFARSQVSTVKTAFGDINAFKIDVTIKDGSDKAHRFTIVAKGNGTYTARRR